MISVVIFETDTPPTGLRLVRKHPLVKLCRILLPLCLGAALMLIRPPAGAAQEASGAAEEASGAVKEASGSAGEWFAKGLEAFRHRKIDESSAYFLEASRRDPADAEYQLYLGISHHQAGRFADAEQAYSASLSLGADPGTVLLRRGNLRWSMGDTSGARLDYTAVIETGGASVPSALLNRANIQLNLGLYEPVIEDYGQYLALVPDAPDRNVIERILALLNSEIEAERRAEARRLAEDAKKAEEEQRRRALMAEVLDSLKEVGEDTTSISAGSENLREGFEVSDLED